jgi:hypothetical protein
MRGQSLDFWVRACSDIILRFVLQGISFEACWGAGGCVGSRMGLRDGSLGFEELESARVDRLICELIGMCLDF